VSGCTAVERHRDGHSWHSKSCWHAEVVSRWAVGMADETAGMVVAAVGMAEEVAGMVVAAVEHTAEEDQAVVRRLAVVPWRP
jgi:hypothetical protein